MVSTPVYDVIIVGAGLSGLQAAAIIQRAGLSCVILEANDRIGGKVLSVPNLPDSEHTVDVGAAWINDTSQPRMWALGQKYGVQFEKQVDEGDTLFDIGNGQVSRISHGELPGTPEEQSLLAQLIGSIDETGATTKAEGYSGQFSQKLDRMNFQRWVFEQSNGSSTALGVADFLCRALFGADACELSSLYVLKYIENGKGFANLTGSGKDSAQYLRPYQGSSTYVRGLASELTPTSIQLSFTVTKITQSGQLCIVSSSATGHDVAARKVIITIPTPLYHHITFNPPLPGSKLALTAATKLGYYTKLVCVYASPWWREAGLGSGMQSLAGPISLALDTCIPSQNQYSLSLFMIGPPGRKWSEQRDAAQRTQAALDHLTSVFQPQLEPGQEVPPPLRVIEQDWTRTPWIEGAPTSLYPVDVLVRLGEGGATLREPFGHVHFAGTETSDVWQGYMEGAVRSGERAAGEVIEALLEREGGGGGGGGGGHE